MAARRPRDRERTIGVTQETVRELARAYVPALRFAARERFFPLLAESWLTHASSAPWPDGSDPAGGVRPELVRDLPPDPHRRGTAIMRHHGDDAPPEQIGGAPNPRDRPIQLTTDDDDPDAIGRPELRSETSAVYLNVGGWRPAQDGEPERRAGDTRYLYRLGSELAAAMTTDGRRRPWLPLDAEPNLPHAWVPQPANVTIYAEVEWAGAFPRIDRRVGTGDFASPAARRTYTGIDGFLCVTYYLLYAARVPPRDEEMPRPLEGQWEAVSLFFRARPVGNRGEDGRPRSFTFSEPPAWVVASQGADRSGGGPEYPALAKRWDEVERVELASGRLSTAVVLYVAEGTHRFNFQPFAGVREPEPPDEDELVYYDPGEPVGAWAAQTAIYGAGGIGAAYAAVLASAAGFASTGVGLIVAALLLIFLAILSLCAALSGQDDRAPRYREVEEARGDGAAVDPVEPAAGDPAVVASDPDVPPEERPLSGEPNAGSPTGRDSALPDVRVVDLLHLAKTHTSFPTAALNEHPSWWDYSGAWGVRVRGGLATKWEDGTRRVDEHGRSLAYWNAVQLACELNRD